MSDYVYGGDARDFLATYKRLQGQFPQPRVPNDYVCVIHPSLIGPLFDAWPLHPGEKYITQEMRLLGRLGRDTYVIPDAPEDRVEYMPPIVMYAKYNGYFAGIAKSEKGEE